MKQYILAVATLLIALLITIIALYKKGQSLAPLYINQQIKDLSYIKTKLVEIRINTIEFTKLDPNQIDILEKKSEILSQIKKANGELSSGISAYHSNKNQAKKISLRRLVQNRIDKKYGTPALLANSEQISSFAEKFVNEYEKINATTRSIYNIYLPSDYQEYNVDISAYYQGELKDNNIFTDVKNQVEEIDKNKFNTKDLVIKLGQLQVLFDECLNQIDKEIITYSDIGVCEDALSIDELKDITYQTELSYFAGNNVLESITNLTNTVYELEAVINKMMADNQNN